METLHRLAGVQDTSDLSSSDAALPPQPVSAHSDHPPPPLPKDTDEWPGDGRASRRASRASLPLNRQPSHKSFKSRSNSRRNSSSRSRKNSTSGRLPADYPPTPRIDHKDFGGQVTARLNHAAATLPSLQVEADPQGQQPLSQRASGESGRSGATGPSVVGEGETEEDDGFTWGPTHPCFPHPNCHVSRDSPAYSASRVIRVRRDYLSAGDLYPQYQNLFPEILDPLVTEADFRFVVSNVNRLCREAFEPCTRRAWVDSLLGAFTGYVWEDLGLTNAKKGEKALENFVDKWNRQRDGERKGVQLMHCRRTGFMSLDFVIPDPGIDDDADQEDDE